MAFKFVLFVLLILATCNYCDSVSNSFPPECDFVVFQHRFGLQYDPIGVCWGIREDKSLKIIYDTTTNRVFSNLYDNEYCNGDGESWDDGLTVFDSNNLGTGHLCGSYAFAVNKITTNYTTDTILIQTDYHIDSGIYGACGAYSDTIYYQYNSCEDDKLSWNWYSDNKCTKQIKPKTMSEWKTGRTAEYYPEFSHNQKYMYHETKDAKFEYIASDIICLEPHRQKRKGIKNKNKKYYNNF